MNDSILVFGLLGTLMVLVGMIAFVVLLYKGVIRDENKNFVPDDIEDAAEEAIDRVENVADELGDVWHAAKGNKDKLK